ncbi:phosphate ABC transporter substrate-binding protein PstS [Novosphingobium rosa]|uniref:phosphate ABC transporter substrate-binding protein PstS n=1 Tax=Novosphingobium rosa TaxID=76978 RepID=UPI00082FB36F|nr:phosphate ABC transporter substrate-binding protein PstS [Novosphingobium rosa]
MWRHKLLGAACAMALAVPAARAESVMGAGASFPAPLYTAWARAWHARSGDEVNYQPIGSGGGLRQIRAGTVDFGASDRPLTRAQLDADALVQFPAVIGGIVPVFNVPGVGSGQLRLTGPVLGEIFLGHIRRWNDPALARLNPGLRLPALPITVVHRADGSGSTYLFTSWLSRVSPSWQRGPGASDAVNWPAGIGAKGNDGVAVFVQRTLGSIGYLEYTFAHKVSIAQALVQNRAGAFVAPTPRAFALAADGVPWGSGAGEQLLMLDRPGAGSWPISGASFILMRRMGPRRAGQGAVMRFLDWALAQGDAAAQRLDYVPLSGAIKAQVRQGWKASGLAR